MTESDPKRTKPLRLPSATDSSAEALKRRRQLLEEGSIRTSRLAGEEPDPDPATLSGRVEGFVGYSRIPVGVFGPLRIRGDHAQGDYVIPIATSEGALVMSYQHVANMLQRGDGIRAKCTDCIVWRAPGFVFRTLDGAAAFAESLAGLRPKLEAVVAEGSRHCRLKNVEPAIFGREVLLRLGFETADAAGQNMVTNAAQAICGVLVESAPAELVRWQIESNDSGDKKATAMAMQSARGKRAVAEIFLSPKLCQRYYRATPDAMLRVWHMSTHGTAHSGAAGCQGNYANAIAGLFIACGQDVACVGEAASGLTTVEITEEGDFYCSVTLPNLIVGTVGGGTSLPTAKECLAMLDCVGAGRAKAFAEICAAVTLCGELALIGAMAGGSFARAHAEAGERSAKRPD